VIREGLKPLARLATGRSLAQASKARTIHGISPQHFPGEAGASAPDKGIKAAGEHVVAHFGSKSSVSWLACGSELFGEPGWLARSSQCHNGIHGQYLARHVSRPRLIADLLIAEATLSKKRPLESGPAVGRESVSRVDVAHAIGHPRKNTGSAAAERTARKLQVDAADW
jgi:hypothetical protein